MITRKELAEHKEGAERRVRGALRRLPMTEGADLDHEVEWLAFACLCARGAEHPRNRAAGSAEAIRLLQRLTFCANKLRLLIDDLPREAMSALERATPGYAAAEATLIPKTASRPPSAIKWLEWNRENHPEALVERLAALIEAAQRAVAALGANPFVARRDVPKKATARNIAENAASTYRRLTGKRPTFSAHGRFVGLLTDLFKIFGIQANAEAQARAILMDKGFEKNEIAPKIRFENQGLASL